MPSAVNIGTGSIPLEFAKELTAIVNEEWKNGTFISKVTPITKDLLRYWFSDSFCMQRKYNFHEGQTQAILNTIYIHEIIKSSSLMDMYSTINEELLAEIGISKMASSKYNYPKYAIKMATGTGKTWVMHVLLLWQYLNAKYEDNKTGRFTKNFLLVAPGLIVYERLLDAYTGKVNEKGIRDFNTSDFKKYEELFLPEVYRNSVYSFIENNVVKKEEIGSKVTGEGIIAITNWHLLSGVEEESEDGIEDTSNVIKDILPITPGTTSGHALNTLDNSYLSGKEIEFLINLKDILVINDEAHHIHENKTAGEISEVEWQKSLNAIAETKGKNFMQVDFSATPYNVTGSGQKRTKHYFPHIIIDFDLKTAIQNGLVKAIVLDKRKEIASQKLAELDFKAEREGKKVVGLSQGQKIMLRAGMQKLKILENQFVKFTEDKNGVSNKYPKMLVVCEDTNVSPFVVEYMVNELGLAEDDLIQIDSDKKGEVKEKQWNSIKQKLFNVDLYSKPKVIVSVLMLREGFDVNNICVIVPLRSSEAPILLEQIIGRGLRLMWREREYQDLKRENRIKLLKEKKEPSNYFDILSIIEHPRFMEFYEDLIKEGLINESKEIPESKESVLGDLIKVGIREEYEKYDLYFPVIIQDSEEIIVGKKINIKTMTPYDMYPLEKLKKLVCKKDDTFYSEELTVKTRFGNYEVSADIFNAKSYNEYISKIIKTISSSIERVGIRKTKRFPLMQINTAELASNIDKYIRYRLFNREFNPFIDNNWRVLLLNNTGIIEHIIREVSKVIYEIQNNIKVTNAVILKRYFSEVPELKMREKYSVPVSKSIYERLPFPVNKGGFERDFINYCDKDSEVDSFVKINEYYHEFVNLNYIREDGLIASYFPDFIVKIKDNIYLVETKAQKDLNNENVKNKEKSAYAWIEKINKLKSSDRIDYKWNYVLLGENTYYTGKQNGSSIKEIFEFAKITRYSIKGDLFSLIAENNENNKY